MQLRQGGKVVDSPAFAAWFKNSKVVDSNGNPLIVYHGTNSDFSVFDTTQKPAWFTPDKKYAKWASNKRIKREGGKVIPAYLSLQNPLDLYHSGFDNALDDITLADLERIAHINIPADKRGNTEQKVPMWIMLEHPLFIAELKNAGYDGLIVLEDGNKHFAAFKPEQIKLADGNNITFDSNNQDMHYRAGGVSGYKADYRGDGSPSKPYDLRMEFPDLIYKAEHSKEEIQRLAKWLRERPMQYVNLYHGSPRENKEKILAKGILPTSDSRRHSQQSQSGYVYLSVFPSMANQFADMAAPANKGKHDVYEVTCLIKSLLPDHDQLYNQRMHAGRDVGDSLAESLLYGHGVRVKGKVDRNQFRIIGQDDVAYFKKGGKIVSGAVNKVKCYRGSDYDSSDWKISAGGQLGMGIYFSTDIEKAAAYGSKLFVCEILLENVGFANEIVSYREIKKIFYTKQTAKYLDDNIFFKEDRSWREIGEAIGRDSTPIRQELFNKMAQKIDAICYEDGFEICLLKKQNILSVEELMSGKNNLDYAKGGLLAPNGKKSNLTPAQWHTVRTPEFKKWFGDWEHDTGNASKVLDENGEPKVVYHGSNIYPKFYDFKTDLWGLYAAGAYFTDDLNEATQYAGIEFGFTKSEKKLIEEGFGHIQKPFVHTVFLNIRNPYFPLRYDTLIPTQQIKDLGHDGCFVEKNDAGGLDYVIFKPEQAKLADGSNNTFDIRSSDIRLKKGGILKPQYQFSDEIKDYCMREQCGTFALAFQQYYGGDIIALGQYKQSNWYYSSSFRYPLPQYSTSAIKKDYLNHIIIKLEDKFYDVNGQIELDKTADKYDANGWQFLTTEQLNKQLASGEKEGWLYFDKELFADLLLGLAKKETGGTTDNEIIRTQDEFITFGSLPDDMQQKIRDFTHREHIPADEQFEVVDYPMEQLPSAIETLVTQGGKGTEYALENFGKEQKYPVLIVQGILVDGWHRSYGVQQRGEQTVKAIVLKTGGAVEGATEGVIEGAKNLAGVHNLDLEHLKHADEIGGLPLPSIAIININHPFVKYGKITLVAPKSLYDPQQNDHSHIFNRDVWSPTYPPILSHINYNKLSIAEKTMRGFANKNINKESHEYSEVQSDISRLLQDIETERYHLSDILNNYRSSEGLIYLFSQMENIPFAIPYKKKGLVFISDGGDEEKKKIVKALEERVREKYTDYAKLDYSESENKRKLTEAYLDLEMYAQELLYTMRKGTGNLRDTLRDMAKERTAEYIDSDTGFLYMPKLHSLKNDLYTLTDAPQVVDKIKMREGLEKLADSHREQYDAWLTKMLDGVFGDEYILDGRSKLPHTLPNVERMMAKQAIKGGEKTVFFGLGKAAVQAAKEYKTLDDVKKESSTIVSDAAFEKFVEQQEQEWGNLVEKLRQYYREQGFSLDALDDLAKVIGKVAASDNPTDAGIRQALARNRYGDVPQKYYDSIRKFSKLLRNTPTQYFEVKLTRSVQLSEFAGAVVPMGMPEAVAILKKHGITNIAYYDKGASGELLQVQRMEALHQVVQKHADELLFKKGGVLAGSESAAHNVIYHFTESIDSLYGILANDTLLSGEKTNYGRGYENISFTFNPNLWDLIYLGDEDYRWKVKIEFDYERMKKKWQFKSFDYGIEEEDEMIIEANEINGISEFINKIYISSEYGKAEIEAYKRDFPNIKFVSVKRKKYSDADKLIKGGKVVPLYSKKLHNELRERGYNVNIYKWLGRYNVVDDGHDIATQLRNLHEWSVDDWVRFIEGERKRRKERSDAGYAMKIGGEAKQTVLLAPNGKPSKLNAVQYALVRTPAFKNWFGDWENAPETASKVVDENGEPLVVYHGSLHNFNIFRRDKIGRVYDEISDSMKSTGGFYFSDSNHNAATYEKRREKTFWDFFRRFRVKSFFLNMRNPLVFDAAGKNWDCIDKKNIQGKEWCFSTDDISRNTHKGKTHDGVIFKNIIDTADNKIYKEVSNSFVAFQSKQIKLADGVNSTFQRSNPDIRFRQGGDSVIAEPKAEVLLAPNGKPSKLNAVQYALVRTPAFKNWFGDWEHDKENASKALDENGEPKVYVHAAPKTFMDNDEPIVINVFEGFREFTDEKTNIQCNPIWFMGSDLDPYASGDEIQFIYVFINARKLFNPENKAHLNLLEKYSGNKFPAFDWIIVEERFPQTPAQIKSLGFDSYISYEDTWRDGKKDSPSLAVFSAHQIKLADGTNIKFNPNNPDIRFRKGGEIEPVLNEQGGYTYTGEDEKTAKAVDLITLPRSVDGTNCSNCKFFENNFCKHPQIQLPVNSRMCCAAWDAEGTHRSWKQEPISAAPVKAIEEKFKQNEQGGLDYTGEAEKRAEKFDLLTLPEKVPGTNCSNCFFYSTLAKGGFCFHHSIWLPVTSRMSCGLWMNFSSEKSWSLFHEGGKLSYRQKIADSEAFKKWFGNSKAIDEEGLPKIFYHGSNRKFDAFDWSRNRDVRNSQFQGNGFFFTDDVNVAWAYARAAVNQVLLRDEVYKSLDMHYPEYIARFAKDMIEHGWQAGWKNAKEKYGEDAWRDMVHKWEKETGSDVNEFQDLMRYVEGNNYEQPEPDALTELTNFFFPSPTTLPDWVYNDAVKYHFENALPQFNVVPVFLKMENPLITDDADAAQAAQKGYDSVIYTGDGTVKNSHEYIVYSPNQIKHVLSKGFNPDSEIMKHADGGTADKTPEQAAKEFIDSLPADALAKIKETYFKVRDEALIQEQAKLDGMEEKKAALTAQKDELYQKERGAVGKEKGEIMEARMEKYREISAMEPDILFQKNKVAAIRNGGDLTSFTDMKGMRHADLPTFTKIKTAIIEFDEETILADAQPPYIPFINEDMYARRGYVLDAIRIDKDTYITSIEKHEEADCRCVLLTLDQLVLTNQYYFTKAKAIELKKAKDSNERQDKYWDSLPQTKRESFLNQKGLYFSLPAKIQKTITREAYETLPWQEKEKLYKFYTRASVKRLQSKLEENQMWVSFHKMYERFINPDAKEIVITKLTDINELFSKGVLTAEEKAKGDVPRRLIGTWGNPEVFAYWRSFRDMMEWKVKDLQVQREDLSDIRKSALETSFGDSNTDAALKKKYGILVKRQNGDKINAIEISEIEMAWRQVQAVYGNLRTNALAENMKISHTGKRYVFSSRAIGMFVPTMHTIAISNKYGEIEFKNTMAHEVAHWIDSMLGDRIGKRFATDDYESLAGKIAFAFRNHLNLKTDSKYLNATKECFARAFQQYFAIANQGEHATIVYDVQELDSRTPYFTANNFVSRTAFYEKIKPMIEQFLQEHKDLFDAGVVEVQTTTVDDAEQERKKKILEQARAMRERLKGKGLKEGGTIRNLQTANSLLAPNGKPSNLTPEQWNLVRTPAFKEWFGDWEHAPETASKAVDENGEPLVVYHGTINKFTIFNKKKIGSNFGVDEKGFFFSSSINEAKYAAEFMADGREDKSEIILQCFLKISSPITESTKNVSCDYFDNNRYWLLQRAAESNSDGIIIKGIGKYSAITFCVFEPNQIKLADGTNATFDATSPDIRYGKGGLLAPNGKPSNLTPEQWKLVRTPEFKKWFGDWENSPETASKVVDENGEPKVVYHGSAHAFTEFKNDQRHKNDAGWLGLGNYFNASEKVAKWYRDKKVQQHRVEGDGYIYSCFLNIRNPKHVSLLDEKQRNIGFDTERARDYTETNKAQGYDGVIGSADYQPTEYCVYAPNQIKLADGSNTTFGQSDDMRHQQGGTIVGEEMNEEFRMPTVDEVLELLENETSRQGSKLYPDGSDYDEDAQFSSKDKAWRFAEEVHGIFKILPDMIPVYRTVSADEVDLDPYGIGESWSWELSAAKEFGSHLGNRRKLKVISGYVPKQNIDIEASIRAYANFSDLGDAESEFEVVIPANRKIYDVRVTSYDEAKPLPAWYGKFADGGDINKSEQTIFGQWSAKNYQGDMRALRKELAEKFPGVAFDIKKRIGKGWENAGMHYDITLNQDAHYNLEDDHWEASSILTRSGKSLPRYRSSVITSAFTDNQIYHYPDAPPSLREDVDAYFKKQNPDTLLRKGGKTAASDTNPDKRYRPVDFKTHFNFTWGQRNPDDTLIVAYSTSSVLLPEIAKRGIQPNSLFESTPVFDDYGSNYYARQESKKDGGFPITLYVKLKSAALTPVDGRLRYSLSVPPENILGLRYVDIDVAPDDFIPFASVLNQFVIDVKKNNTVNVPPRKKDIFYHGTSTKKAKAIRKEGLNEPYLTDLYAKAEYYAEVTAEEDGSEPIVLEVSVPDKTKLRVDSAELEEPVIVEGMDEDVEESIERAYTRYRKKYPESYKRGIVTIKPEHYNMSLDTVHSVWYDGKIAAADTNFRKGGKTADTDTNPDKRSEYFAWRRNKEGGQKAGNLQENVPITREIFEKHVKQGLRKEYRDYDKWMKKFNATHVTHILFYDGKEIWTKVGTLDDLRPHSEWVKQVKSWDSPEAQEWISVADSDIDEPKRPIDFNTEFDFTWGDKLRKTGEIIVAHNTTSALLPQIAKEGLKAGRETNWDDGLSGNGRLFFEIEPTHTYFGQNVYAWKATQKYGGEPITLYVKMKVKDLKVDTDDSELGSQYVKNQRQCFCDVPPENILGLRWMHIDVKPEDFIQFAELINKYSAGGKINPTKSGVKKIKENYGIAVVEKDRSSRYANFYFDKKYTPLEESESEQDTQLFGEFIPSSKVDTEQPFYTAFFGDTSGRAYEYATASNSLQEIYSTLKQWDVQEALVYYFKDANFLNYIAYPFSDEPSSENLDKLFKKRGGISGKYTHVILKQNGKKYDIIPGGLAEGMTLADIAKHHRQPVSKLKQQLKKGIKVEMEHTTSKDVAEEIATDHLFEDADYYKKLAKIEEELEKTAPVKRITKKETKTEKKAAPSVRKSAKRASAGKSKIDKTNVQKKAGGKVAKHKFVRKEESPKVLRARWEKKKEALTVLANNIRSLKYNVSRDLSSDDERTFLTALAVALMLKTGERVGNDASAANGHLGITGLCKKNVSVKGNVITLSYVGKSGVKHDKEFTDADLAKHLKRALKLSSGKYLLQASDRFRIKSDRVNAYLASFGGITAKDIRGYNSNHWIISKLKAVAIPEEENDRRKLFNKIVKEIAKKVGHGAPTLKKHYMLPELETEYIEHGKILDLKTFYEGGET